MKMLDGSLLFEEQIKKWTKSHPKMSKQREAQHIFQFNEHHLNTKTSVKVST